MEALYPASVKFRCWKLNDPYLAACLVTNRFGTADPYMTVADFTDYCRAQREVEETFRDANKFGRMSLTNIAKAGIFSSDRSVREYAENIWYL